MFRDHHSVTLQLFCAKLHDQLVKQEGKSNLNEAEKSLIEKLAKDPTNNFGCLSDKEFSMLGKSQAEDLRMVRNAFEAAFSARQEAMRQEELRASAVVKRR